MLTRRDFLQGLTVVGGTVVAESSGAVGLVERVVMWGGGLPNKTALLMKTMLSSGLSGILFQSGDTSTWQTTAVWGFERTAGAIAIDDAMGGGILFVGTTPKYWTWAQWVEYPGINENFLFIGFEGIVGYGVNQEAKASRILDYLSYFEPVIDYYVDSNIAVSGDGLTSSTPLKTIADILALNPPAGSVIGLAAGSHWREKFLYPNNNITLKSYGIGDYPLLDSSDIVSPGSFSKTAGRTNIYEVSIDVETGVLAAEYPSIWVDDVRLTKTADLATCDTTPGSYYHANVVDATRITVYIHAPGSTNPASDGKTYEASIRSSGADCYDRTGCIIKGIRGRRNYTSYGSITVGSQCLAIDCKADDGNTHNLFVRPSGRAVQCSAHNFYDSSASPIPFIMYSASPDATDELPFYDCTVTSDTYVTPGLGFYCHTGGPSFASVTYKNCNADNCSTPYGSANTQVLNVIDGVFSNFLAIFSASTPVVCNGIIGTSAKTGAHWGNFTSGCSDVTIDNCNVAFNTTGHIRPLVANQEFTFRNNTITGANTVLNQTSALTGVKVTITDNTFIPAGRMSVIYNVIGTMDLTSDNNDFGGATGKWAYNGVDYLNLAAWQATGRDLNSTNVA